jgi:iron(III) transport system substrate-binding protein
MATYGEISGGQLSRRALLRLTQVAGIGVLGAVLSACAPATTAPAPTPAAVPPGAPASAPTPAAAAPTTAPTQAATQPAATQPAATAPATTAPAQVGSAPAGWDQLVAAAQKEGKVVVSGPPDPDTRSQLPAAFKQRFNIDVEYLGGNSGQLATRMQTERAANQYTVDVSLAGPDTMWDQFLGNNWVDPIEPVLMLPEVIDPKVWPTGRPWFRDPAGNTILQLSNTISPFAYVNTTDVSDGDIKTTDDLLDPKWKGKIASYDPSVNGGGLIDGSVIYVTKGEDFARQLYQNQGLAFSRDYQQLADWVAHDNFAIVMGAAQAYIDRYAGLPIQRLVVSDLPAIVAGSFALLSLFNNAPHPNAAKVFVNWIASREGTTVFARTQAAAPVRTDIDATAWVRPEFIPKPGVEYFDVYGYQYAKEVRKPSQQLYGAIIGG